MKRFLLTILTCLFLGMPLAAIAADIPVAILTPDTEGNYTTLTFTMADESTITPEDQWSSSKGSAITFRLNGNGEEPAWVTEDLMMAGIDTYYLSTVKFDPSFANARPTSAYKWFYYFELLSSIEGLENFNASEVTDMSFMFYQSGCHSIDLSGINAGKVTNMEHMFDSNYKVESIDLSGISFDNVTSIGGMFSGCNSLKTINFGTEVNIPLVTDMSRLFYGCSSLTSVDLSGFKTRDVTSLANMFERCSKLTSVTFGDNFDTSNVTTIRVMFYDCSALTKLDISRFNLDKLTEMDYMCYGCSGIKELNVGGNSFENMTDESNYKNAFNGVGDYYNPIMLIVNDDFKLDGTFSTIFDKDKSTSGYSWMGGYFLLAFDKALKISPVGYATFSPKRNIDVSKTEGIKAYTVKYDAAAQTITLNPVSAVHYDAAVVFKGAPGEYTPVSTGSYVSTMDNNDLKVSSTDITADGSQWILASRSGKVGFAKATPGTTIIAGKGYLLIPTSAAAKDFISICDNSTTGIDLVKSEEEKAINQILYNLAGQRVDQSYKGVVIMNGKKYIKK